jgi:hypoxanthine phosphoribosyltransferase
MLDNRSEFERVIYDGKFRILLSEEQIDARIRELGKEISRDYRGKNPIMIGVLNGGFIFMADLVRHIEIDVEVDFIKISSYGDATTTSGSVKMLKDINADIRHRHILVVEDIVDTGLSFQFLTKKFCKLEPASLEFVSLLQKKANARVDYHIKYLGFDIPNEYVVGYGLDHKQILRNLPSIYVMD